MIFVNLHFEIREIGFHEIDSFQKHPMHMSDSIQGTDYIATYFFLNLKVSRAKIEKSEMMNQWRYYSANLQKICNIVGSKT